MNMELEEFINRWDERIDNWMENPYDCSDTYLNNYCNYFQMHFMPEPYLGNPEHCSFVIINLNPGQGRCHSCYNNKDNSNYLISDVLKYKYSKIAFKFQYLKNEENTKYVDWENNKARKWWKNKEPWIKNVNDTFVYKEPSNTTEENIKINNPFAIELCAWHSTNWPSKFDKIDRNDNPLKEEIGNIVSVICKAIDESQYKFAYSVGKPIGDMLKKFDFVDVELPFIKDGDGYLIKKETKRYYRLLCDEDRHFVINTWSIGSNNYPSKSFYDTDKIIFCKIMDKINLI